MGLPGMHGTHPSAELLKAGFGSLQPTDSPSLPSYFRSPGLSFFFSTLALTTVPLFTKVSHPLLN